MRKHEDFCDVCGKEVKQYTVVSILIGDHREWGTNTPWKYKNNYSFMVCDDCIDSKIERCNGSHGHLSIKDKGKNLLSKLGLIKKNKI